MLGTWIKESMAKRQNRATIGELSTNCNNYHGMMLGSCAAFGNYYQFCANWESGLARFAT